MKNTGTLKLTTPTEREIMMTRVFDSPSKLVFDALTKPELLKRWFSMPPGWSLAIYEIDLKVGGAYRHVWRGPDGTGMGMHGVFREIAPPERFVATGTFDDSRYPGEAVGKHALVEQNGKTHPHFHHALRSAGDPRPHPQEPMEEGVSASYGTLAEMLASALTQGAT